MGICTADCLDALAHKEIGVDGMHLFVSDDRVHWQCAYMCAHSAHGLDDAGTTSEATVASTPRLSPPTPHPRRTFLSDVTSTAPSDTRRTPPPVYYRSGHTTSQARVRPRGTT